MKDSALRCFSRLEECNTLKSLCLERIVFLYTHPRKRRQTPSSCQSKPRPENPFASLPGNLVADLVETSVRLSPKARDNMTPDVRQEDLELLVSSGRLRRFSLWDVEMHSKEFSGVLKKLSQHSSALKEIEIDGVYVRGKRPESIFRSFKTINQLLRSSPQLQVLRLGVSGDSLMELLGLNKLEHLSLSFDCRQSLDDVLHHAALTGRDLCPRLRCFEYNDYFSTPSTATVAHILQNCPYLVELKADCSAALVQFHQKQFLTEGHVTQRYRLRKAVLGSCVYGQCDGSAFTSSPSPLCAQILVETCPNLVDLELYIDSHDTLICLAELSHLQFLKLMWVGTRTVGNFDISTLSLLHEIGCQLSELCLHSFTGVDLDAIASICPSLEALGLIQCRTVCNHIPESEPFTKITRLRIIPPTEYPSIQAEADIACLLASCPSLKSFVVDFVAESFAVLVERILSANRFSCLELAGVYFQQPTADLQDGVFRFVTACKMLKYLVVADSDVYDYALEANPCLKVRYEYLYVGL
ncbi:uncharacterized protein LOC135393941 [Ornithodoros turicata]|uniref:uncharacterized protein LOC135393941 n=1 Tax=Ornithodoros turicata TaxID=34597 RepID=UPI003138ADE9